MAEEVWMLQTKKADFKQIGARFRIDPVTARIIRNRGIEGEAAIDRYLNGTLDDLYDPMLLKDMERAVSILCEAVDTGKKIRIVGDYDIDGVCSTYILLQAFERLGSDVDFEIPDRIKDGYGINESIIEQAHADGVEVILTCDNGISAFHQVELAKKYGMTVVITDHHEVPFEEEEDGKNYLLPPADAVIDPKQPGCEYPFKGLCGAAIAYKLVEALWEATGGDAEDLDYLIENVAIATVGDVMELEDENRIFVKEGLQMLKRTHSPGLRSLIACTGVDKDRIGAYHIGFVLGPCMNASGRLDTAKRTLDLLRAKAGKEADILAGDLKALNDSRKEMTDIAVEQARQIVDTTKAGQDRVLVLYLPGCHESLAGIGAGRIRERYYRPAIILTDAEEGIKGSGRSIEAYNMYEELSRCKDLLTKFGGHKLAAGMSLAKENIEELRRTLNDNCRLEPKDMAEKVVIDMELPFSCVTEELVEELTLLEPFGKGNTKPVFAARNVELISGRILGKNRNVLKLQVKDSSQTAMEAVCFRGAEQMLSLLEERYGKEAVDLLMKGRGSQMKLSVTYYPDMNEYMGKRTVQIVITHYQ